MIDSDEDDTEERHDPDKKQKQEAFKHKTDALLKEAIGGQPSAVNQNNAEEEEEEENNVTWQHMYDSMLQVYQQRYPDAGNNPDLRQRRVEKDDEYDEEMKELFRQHQATPSFE